MCFQSEFRERRVHQAAPCRDFDDFPLSDPRMIVLSVLSFDETMYLLDTILSNVLFLDERRDGPMRYLGIRTVSMT